MKSNKQTSFLLGVFCCDKHTSQNDAFFKENKYPDLQDLKKRIERNQDGPQHRPYSSNKKKVMVYQGIFLTFSILFLSLLSLIYFKTTNWTCTLYFGNCMLVKTIICTLSMSLSFLALGSALAMSTEKETVYHLAKRAKKKLRRIFSKRRAEEGIGGIFLFGEELKKARLMKHCLQEIEEKIEDKLREVLLLVGKIKQTNDIGPEIKEDLYNQAILEFHDQLHAVIKAS